MKLLPILAIAVLLQDFPTFRPKAKIETEPVPSSGDSADDPAIWIHPTDPALSLILGTDKNGALHAYTMDGKEHSKISDSLAPNNVDLRMAVKFGEQEFDIAGASVRGKQKGVMLWTIDPKTREIREALDKAVAVFGGDVPYGFCLYRRAKDGALFFFVSHDNGGMEQYRVEREDAKFKASRVRAWRVGSIVEGCVADDEYGLLYLSEETVAIWRYGAEPDDPTDPKHRVKVAGTTGRGAFRPDAEGLAIYYAGEGKGYLLVSSQGNDRFNLYKRDGANEFVGIIDPEGSDGIDDVSDTDGIDVINAPAGPNFPKGCFVAQDGSNAGARQNFKVFGWEDVAGKDLLVDPSWDPRKPVWRRR